MLKDYPLVSIITVVYNGAATIEQTMQSVLNQSYQNIEYIIIDGGSTDGTQDIVNKYKEHLSYFASEKDNGIYDAMNKGIRHAAGDIIGIINSDDWYADNAVEMAVKSFEKDKLADVVYGNLMYLKKEGNMELIIPPPIEDMWRNMAIPHPTVFIMKRIYEKYGLFELDYKICADYELLLKLYSNKVHFKYIDETLAYFRWGGISQSRLYERGLESNEIAYKHIDKCPNKENILPQIRCNKGMLLLEETLSNNPGKVINMLEDYFKTKITELVIFGTGDWGNKCYNGLSNTDIEIIFFVDNNSISYEFHNKIIKKPSELAKENYVLIAVRNGSDEIEKQLKDMGIASYVSISELVNKYLLPGT